VRRVGPRLLEPFNFLNYPVFDGQFNGIMFGEVYINELASDCHILSKAF
jgi:hypothetical protein